MMLNGSDGLKERIMKDNSFRWNVDAQVSLWCVGTGLDQELRCHEQLLRWYGGTKKVLKPSDKGVNEIVAPREATTRSAKKRWQVCGGTAEAKGMAGDTWKEGRGDGC
ncbi:unnamed protein product [Haemonchus placei]|uniref:Uncharacterized protein n=1 Tax=Haemonchus placei TaxID=6290 RepID=A0A0N4WBS6_HAEPC|nr:unnamed protein product [Haemonchus placei]